MLGAKFRDGRVMDISSRGYLTSTFARIKEKEDMIDLS